MTWGIMAEWVEHGLECRGWFMRRTDQGCKLTTFDTCEQAQQHIDKLKNPQGFNTTLTPRELS